MPRSRGRKQKGKNRTRTEVPSSSEVPTARSKTSSFLEQIRERWWFRSLRRIFGVLVILLGVIASIYGIWGPIWPTAPEFSPGAPSFSLALDVPFNVANKSSLFEIRNLTIECHVIFARLSVSHKSLRNVTIGIEGRPYDSKQPLTRNNIKAGGVSSYVCPMSGGPIAGFGPTPEFPDDKLETATIEFLSEYDVRLPWRGRAQTSSGVFTLNPKTNPPQWTQGVPLR
jgi:hypothetical protein